MQIHVARNGQQLGQYSIEEVNRQLADGTLSATDLGWYEGAAGWAPLSSVPGVTLPAVPALSQMTAPSAIPSPVPAPAITRTVPASPAAPTTPQSYKGMVVTSWILLGVTFVISLVPVLGCGSWFLVWPVAIATLIMAILILSRGGKTQGVLILIASLLIVPLTLVASVISTAALGGAVSKEEHKQEVQIMENLRALAQAKARWVAQTGVKEGASTTVAGLTAYLDGKEIKSIVGETYDPRPIGQKPTALLPATKSLAGHGKGALLTANDSTPGPDEESTSPSTTPEHL